MLRKVLAVLFTTSLITVCLAAQGKPTRPDNNLSVPVIWSDGVTTVLRGDPDLPDFSGDYWLWWPEGACLADSRTGTCKDKKVTPPADYEIVYPQQETSAWQAESLRLIPAVDPPLGVDWINWSDNLESIDQRLDVAVLVSVVLSQNPGSQEALNRSEAAGGEAKLDLENQLTYIDIVVLEYPRGGNGGS